MPFHVTQTFGPPVHELGRRTTEGFPSDWKRSATEPNRPSRPNTPRRLVFPGPEYLAKSDPRRVVGATIETSLPNPETEPMRVGLSFTCTLAAYLAPCAGDASAATHMSATRLASTAFFLAPSSLLT